MPIYDFRNKDSGEITERMMSISACEQFLAENPEYELVVTAPAVISGMPMSGPKTDSGFKDVLSRIADANPHSPLAAVHGDKGIRASKTREAVDKEKTRQQSKTS